MFILLPFHLPQDNHLILLLLKTCSNPPQILTQILSMSFSETDVHTLKHHLYKCGSKTVTIARVTEARGGSLLQSNTENYPDSLKVAF